MHADVERDWNGKVKCYPAGLIIPAVVFVLAFKTNLRVGCREEGGEICGYFFSSRYFKVSAIAC